MTANTRIYRKAYFTIAAGGRYDEASDCFILGSGDEASVFPGQLVTGLNHRDEEEGDYVTGMLLYDAHGWIWTEVALDANGDLIEQGDSVSVNHKRGSYILHAFMSSDDERTFLLLYGADNSVVCIDPQHVTKIVED